MRMRGPPPREAHKPADRPAEPQQLRAEIRRDLEATSAYIAKHGSFAQMVRRHYRKNDDG
jgi:hypothetical protein